MRNPRCSVASRRSSMVVHPSCWMQIHTLSSQASNASGASSFLCSQVNNKLSASNVSVVDLGRTYLLMASNNQTPLFSLMVDSSASIALCELAFWRRPTKMVESFLFLATHCSDSRIDDGRSWWNKLQSSSIVHGV